MINHLMIDYIANLYINAAVSFLTAVIIIESFIFLFRLKYLKMYRLMSVMRVIPFIKILYDIFTHYNLSRWALAYGINIINTFPYSKYVHLGAKFYKP